MDRFKRIFEKFSVLSPIKKVGIIFSISFLMVVLLVLLMMKDDKAYSFLYRHLSEEDAGAISEELKTMKVPFKVSGQGNIMVPQEDVAKLRLALAQKKLVGRGIGFELLDQQKYGMTSFMERTNYLRALQGELSRSITQLDAVESSRVHIVLPKRAIFKEDERPATASVILKLKRNEYLSKKQIQGILHLVSASVEGLHRDKISIIDTNGQKLNEDSESGFMSTKQLDFQRKYEEKLRLKVQEILDRALGDGNSIVKIETVHDFDEQTLSEESFDPDATAIRSEKLQEETNSSGRNRIGGIPGSASNNPQAGAPAGTVAKGGTTGKHKKSQVRNYEVSKIIKNKKVSLGKVTKVSVAVLINGRYIKDKSGKEQYTPRSKEEMATFMEIVKRAVGYNPERGDQVEVANMQFADDHKKPIEEAAFYKKPGFYFKTLQYLLYIVILLVVFWIVRAIMGWAMVREEEVELSELGEGDEIQALTEGTDLDELAPGEAGIEHLASPGGESVEKSEDSLEMKLRRRINEIAYDNPEKVIQILRYWVTNH